MQHDTMNLPPWKVIQTPRSLYEQRLIYAQLRRLTINTLLEPDCWLNTDGSAFHITRPRPDNEPVCNALIPGKTIVHVRIWQTAFTNVWHEQVYVGRGYCASFASDDQLILARVARVSRQPFKFHLQHVPAANPTHVLSRVAAALGAMCWDPYRINCQSVTHWLMTGRLPKTTAVASAANEMLFCALAVCGLVCVCYSIIRKK